MFTRLIESRSKFIRNELSTAASAGIHVVLITAAAYVTTATAATESEPDEVVRVHYSPIVSPAQPALSAHRAPALNRQTRPIAAPASLAVNISPDIPDVAVQLGGIRDDDFEDRGGSSSDESNGPGVTRESRDAYADLEVEVPVAMLGGAAVPQYPANLRAAGIEGRVVAQFIVDVSGKTRPGSVKILSSSHDLFSESVRKAVEKMSFRPATIGDRRVAQLVQQLFVFKLDR